MADITDMILHITSPQRFQIPERSSFSSSDLTLLERLQYQLPYSNPKSPCLTYLSQRLLFEPRAWSNQGVEIEICALTFTGGLGIVLIWQFGLVFSSLILLYRFQ